VYTTSRGGEGDAKGARRAENLEFFLSQGLLPQDAGFHFLIVVAGDWPEMRGALDGAAAWAAAHGAGNVEVRWRRNAGFDFCSWREALTDALPGAPLARDARNFSHILLLNGSVKGPFLPGHWPRGRAWPLAFTDLLRGPTRLVGTTVNCERSAAWLHVQSMVVAFGARDLGLWLGTVRCATDFWETVWRNEVGVSQAFLRDGANLGVLQLAFRDADFRDAAATAARCATVGRHLLLAARARIFQEQPWRRRSRRHGLLGVAGGVARGRRARRGARRRARRGRRAAPRHLPRARRAPAAAVVGAARPASTVPRARAPR